MGNPIKTSDLYENTGELKELISELETVQEKLMKLRDKEIKNAKVLEEAVKKLKTSTSKQREELEESAKQASEIEKRYKKYNASLGENGKKLAALKLAQQQINQVNKLEAKLLASKEGSYNRLSAQYSLNKIRLNQLSDAERENTEEGRKLVKTTNEIYQEMKRLQEETGKHTLSVGDYSKATEGLLEKLDDMPGALGAAGDGLSTLDRGFKRIARNPFVFALSVIFSGILAIGTAFRSSEKGARLFEKATAILDGLFSSLVDLSVKVAEGIEYAFENPLEAVKNLGASIVNNIINRIKGLGILMLETGTIIKESLTLNFEEAEAAAGRAAKAVVQIGTGLDNKQQEEALELFKEIKEEIDKNVEASLKLNAARLIIARSNRSLQRSVEELTTKEAVLQAIADDTTKSFAEREKAAADARKALEERNKREIQIAKNNLSLINQEIDLRRSTSQDVEMLLDRQIEAYSALKQAERELTLGAIENDRIRSELIQDRLERDLDILLDGFDNQKTINEKIIADDERTFAERRRLLEETVRLSNESFAKQIETIQKFTGVAIDANDLIGESDAVVLNQKIRALGLSEIIEGRLLEIVRDRRTATQDLADAEKDLNESVEKSIAKQIQLRAKLKNDIMKGLQEGFAQQQALSKSEFDLLKTTEEEKTRFALNAERDRLNNILNLNKLFGKELTDLQIETFRNQIKKIDQELAGLQNRGVQDIYDLFGFNISDEKKDAISQSIGFIKDQYGSLLNERVQLANQAVQAANTEVEQAQRALAAEQEKLLAGEANRAQSAARDLENAKKNQEKGLKEQEKAQKAQMRLDTISQTGGLITASVNIYKSFTSAFGAAGPILAAAAIATMFGTFIASKVKANKLAKQTFGKGNYEVLKGGSHMSGDDVPLGMMDERTERRAEGGEGLAIFAKKRVKQYRNVLPEVVKAINQGTFEEMFMKKNLVDDGFMMMGASGGSVDMSRSEMLLEKIGENTSKGNYLNGSGNLVNRRKNVKTEYV